MSLDKTKICRTIGDRKPLRYTLGSRSEPEILTGHTFSFEISQEGSVLDSVSGDLFLGDCGVYFDIQSPIGDTSGSYDFRLLVDPDAEQQTAAYGTLEYR